MRRFQHALKTMLWAAPVALLALAVFAVVLLPKRTAVEGWSDRAVPKQTVITSLADLRGYFNPTAGAPDQRAYEALARYFIEGWAAYRTPTGERAHYPGAPSGAGRRNDGLEGFSRMFPLVSAWLASGRPQILETGAGQLDLAKALSEGIRHGTDPSSRLYWGTVGDYSPQLVESADVALGLWLSRDFVWNQLDPVVRQRVVKWLTGALESAPFDGNWQMFPMLVHRALKGLDVDVSRWDERIQTNWEYFKTFHRGEGWFYDPPNGFDYYNAWSIQYALFWLRQMDQGFEPVLIPRMQRDFVRFYKHLFGPQGHPEMGRSVCYRMAAPTPLLTAQALAPDGVSKGEAMRALDLTWGVFIGRGALAHGTITQGFCGVDLSTQSGYSGPASCLWSLRSLIVAFALDRELRLFAANREPLPVEKADFRIEATVPGWTLVGERQTGRIELIIPANASAGPRALIPYSWRHRMKEWLLESPRRPDNRPALYGRPSYASDRPVSTCRRGDD